MILGQFPIWLNGHEGHVPLEPLSRMCKQDVEERRFSAASKRPRKGGFSPSGQSRPSFYGTPINSLRIIEWLPEVPCFATAAEPNCRQALLSARVADAASVIRCGPSLNRASSIIFRP